jgi:hypothetical protein
MLSNTELEFRGILIPHSPFTSTIRIPRKSSNIYRHFSEFPSIFIHEQIGLEFHGIPIPEFIGIPHFKVKTPEFHIPKHAIATQSRAS